ncbi:hypothetical protein FRX31_021008, partial [Thalictrum thalictroides]
MQEGETSGEKDSSGNEIHPQQMPQTSAELETQTIKQREPANTIRLNQTAAHVQAVTPVPAGVTSDNPFAVLEDLEEDITHISIPTENPGTNDHQTRDKAPVVEPDISMEEQIPACTEEDANKEAAAIIPALAQLYPPHPSDQFQGIADQLLLNPFTAQSPLLLTNEDTELEEEKEIDENQAMVTYGSDTEIICKNKKPTPPLTMLTRSKTQ